MPNPSVLRSESLKARTPYISPTTAVAGHRTRKIFGNHPDLLQIPREPTNRMNPTGISSMRIERQKHLMISRFLCWMFWVPVIGVVPIGSIVANKRVDWISAHSGLPAVREIVPCRFQSNNWFVHPFQQPNAFKSLSA
jgi:hypothetical protein